MGAVAKSARRTFSTPAPGMAAASTRSSPLVVTLPLLMLMLVVLLVEGISFVGVSAARSSLSPSSWYIFKRVPCGIAARAPAAEDEGEEEEEDSSLPRAFGPGICGWNTDGGVGAGGRDPGRTVLDTARRAA